MKTRMAKIRETLIRFVNRTTPRCTRVWFRSHVVVTHEGRLLRSQRDGLAIDRAFEDETGHDPLWLPDDQPAWKENEEAKNSMGGSIGFRFKKWLARENIRPTPPKHRDVWQAAQVEAKVWNSSEDFD